MASMDEDILKAAKEIVVKFIECGRLPERFAETFQGIDKNRRRDGEGPRDIAGQSDEIEAPRTEKRRAGRIDVGQSSEPRHDPPDPMDPDAQCAFGPVGAGGHVDLERHLQVPDPFHDLRHPRATAPTSSGGTSNTSSS